MRTLKRFCGQSRLAVSSFCVCQLDNFDFASNHTRQEPLKTIAITAISERIHEGWHERISNRQRNNPKDIFEPFAPF
jgi:hypothetical protein